MDVLRAYGWMLTRSMVTKFEIDMYGENEIVDRDTRLTEMGVTTLLIHSLVGRLHCYLILGWFSPLRPGSACWRLL